MKKNYIVSLLAVFFIAALALSACKNKKQPAAQHEQSQAKQYTCPMHPQIIEDHPGSCPICGMDLVERDAHAMHAAADTSLSYLLQPVNEQVIATIPVTTGEEDSPEFPLRVQGIVTYDMRNKRSISSRVSGRIEKLYIKYNYQPVSKGQLIMEVYSPDLAAAQQELLLIKSAGQEDGMLQAAKQRLLLLGMSATQINRVLSTGRVNYKVSVYSNANGYILETSNSSATSAATPKSSTAMAAGGMSGMASTPQASSAANVTTSSSTPSPLFLREGQYVNAGQSVFTIYEKGSLIAEFSMNPTDASLVKKGAMVQVESVAQPEKTIDGTIGLIQPTFKEGQNFTLARVYLKNAELKEGELVNASIPILTKEHLWLPNSALLSLGNETVVFVKEHKVFIPKKVKRGISVDGKTQILDDITDWKIASNAAYLVDSEGFIKTPQQ